MEIEDISRSEHDNRYQLRMWKFQGKQEKQAIPLDNIRVTKAIGNKNVGFRQFLFYDIANQTEMLNMVLTLQQYQIVS